MPYLPSLNETEQLSPAAMAEMPDLAPEAEDETLETDKGLGVAVEAEVADNAVSKMLAIDKGVEVEDEVVLTLTVPVWFNPEAAAL